MRVAVIGASGIGKQHAKWFHLEGCKVAGFAGTSEDSVQRTKQTLQKLFGFSGRGFTSVDEMLAEIKPDIAVVSSPAELHRDHALKALAAGCHIYCEKPLVWSDRLLSEDPVAGSQFLLAAASEILTAAKDAGKFVGVNTQYAAAITDYMALCGFEETAATYPTSFYMKMESKGTARKKEFEVIWADLASHPLSILLKLCPDGVIDETTASLRLERKRNLCRFDYVSPAGSRTAVEIELGQVDEGTPARRFGINGIPVDYSGRNDPDGVYRSYMTCDGKDTVTEDFMQRSVRAFVESLRNSAMPPLTSGQEGFRNLELQLQLLQLAKRISNS